MSNNNKMKYYKSAFYAVLQQQEADKQCKEIDNKIIAAGFNFEDLVLTEEEYNRLFNNDKQKPSEAILKAANRLDKEGF